MFTQGGGRRVVAKCTRAVAVLWRLPGVCAPVCAGVRVPAHCLPAAEAICGRTGSGCPPAYSLSAHPCALRGTGGFPVGVRVSVCSRRSAEGRANSQVAFPDFHPGPKTQSENDVRRVNELYCYLHQEAQKREREWKKEPTMSPFLLHFPVLKEFPPHLHPLPCLCR